MKLLTLPLLLCAMIALSRAAEPSHVVKRATSCGSGWTEHDSRCFCFISSRRTWADAEKLCRYYSSHLASVHSAEEYEWIQDFIAGKNGVPAEAWLGGTDTTQTNHWLWSDGSDFRFAYWCETQPDNMGSQNCLQMNYSAKKCWDDLGCSEQRAFVCAKDK